jgi:hypothetical protein
MLSRTNSTEKGPEDVETSSGMGAPSYYSSNGREPNYEETTELHQSIPVRILHSFKRNPNAQITPNGVLKNDGTIFQTNKGVAPESPLARRLKGRHLQMIAIGGSIGTSSSPRSSSCIRTLSDILRYRSIRGFRQSSCNWWTSLGIAHLYDHWCHDLLCDSSPWRTCCIVSCSWFILCILLAILRPGLGFCYGMGT